MNKNQFTCFILSVFLLTSGCSKEVSNHGFNFENFNFDTIRVGESTKETVLAELGSPTSKSNFGPQKYYYISSKTQKVVFLDPTIIEQKVMEIGFNDKNIVSDITELTLDDANNVIFSENRTDIKGNSLSPMQQIMTNIGKFNKSSKPKL